MAKTIVNKHFETTEQIVREAFNEDIELAKGEIAIHNGERPSIYVLNNEGVPVKIAGDGNGGGGSSVDDSVIEELKTEIYNAIEENTNNVTNAYTEADNVVISGYTTADEELRTEIMEAIEAEKTVRAEADNIINTTISDRATILERTILEKESSILEHTVNNKALKDNPVLGAEDITVGKYSSLVLPENSKENVISDDTTQVAIKKVENMTIANALAFSAALNDVNKKTITYVESNVLDETQEIELQIGKIHVIEDNVDRVKITLSKGDVNNPIDDTMAFEYTLMCSFNENYVLELPEETLYATDTLTNLHEAPMVMFKFKHNFVEIKRMVSVVTNEATEVETMLFSLNARVNSLETNVDSLMGNVNDINNKIEVLETTTSEDYVYILIIGRSDDESTDTKVKAVMNNVAYQINDGEIIHIDTLLYAYDDEGKSSGYIKAPVGSTIKMIYDDAVVKVNGITEDGVAFENLNGKVNTEKSTDEFTATIDNESIYVYVYRNENAGESGDIPVEPETPLNYVDINVSMSFSNIHDTQYENCNAKVYFIGGDFSLNPTVPKYDVNAAEFSISNRGTAEFVLTKWAMPNTEYQLISWQSIEVEFFDESGNQVGYRESASLTGNLTTTTGNSGSTMYVYITLK